MPQFGGGQRMHFPPAFFGWLHQQKIMVDDYAYAGTDFRGDQDLPLPPGAQWTDTIKNLFFGIFSSFMILF